MDLKLLQIQKILENIEADSPKFDLEKIASEAPVNNKNAPFDLVEMKNRLEQVSENILRFVEANTNPIVKFASARRLSDDEIKALFLTAIYKKALFNLKRAAEEDKASTEEKASETRDEREATDSMSEDNNISDVSTNMDQSDTIGELGDILETIDDLVNQTREEAEAAMSNVESEPVEEEVEEEVDTEVSEMSEDLESPPETEDSEEAEEELSKKSHYTKRGDFKLPGEEKKKKNTEEVNGKNRKNKNKEALGSLTDEKSDDEDLSEDEDLDKGKTEDATIQEYTSLKEAMADEENVACISELLKDMNIAPEKLVKMFSDKQVVKKAIANKIATDVTIYRMKSASNKKAAHIDRELKMLMESYLKSLLNK